MQRLSRLLCLILGLSSLIAQAGTLGVDGFEPGMTREAVVRLIQDRGGRPTAIQNSDAVGAVAGQNDKALHYQFDFDHATHTLSSISYWVENPEGKAHYEKWLAEYLGAHGRSTAHSQNSNEVQDDFCQDDGRVVVSISYRSSGLALATFSYSPTGFSICVDPLLQSKVAATTTAQNQPATKVQAAALPQSAATAKAGLAQVDSASKIGTLLDPWIGKFPSTKINGKTFYNQIGIDDRFLATLFKGAGLNASKMHTFEVLRHDIKRPDKIVQYYYAIGYCTVGHPTCTSSDLRAEALLTASINIRPSGDTNLSYAIWMMNEKPDVANSEPVWCITKGPHKTAPIDVRDLHCVQGAYQFGWKTNDPVPYTQTGIVWDDDYDYWILSGYNEFSGFNATGKALLSGIAEAILDAADSQSSNSQGHSCAQDGNPCMGQHLILGGVANDK